ncbi:putative multidrug resistance protein fnx1 [Hypoxylon sp. FL1857]|nr:putative multidrug resistance protein fnx1 [Hypoxylon sp. FL1857]
MASSPKPQASGYGWRFWGIISSLSIMSILSALDISAISTTLPSIVDDLGSDYAYIWIVNAYFLTSTAFQPLYGQTANIFGRRSLTLLIMFLFAVGSAVSGPAPTLGALIAGRAVQGMGGGGINVMIDMIVCDLVPLRERSKFIGIIFGTFSVAVALGPFIGGLLAERVTWRWVFYINLPIAAASWLALALVLRVRYKKDNIRNLLKRVDLGGNAVLVASVVAILLSLTWGGTKFLRLFVFLGIQTKVPEPTMPLRLFFNRTSLGSYGLTFVHSILSYWITYFLPLYFQAVLEADPVTSGVDLLPTVVVSMPFAIIAGVGLSKFGRYRPWHFINVALFAISFGLFSLLNEKNSLGARVLTTTTLPAAHFGGVWGVAIPAVIFNSRVNDLLDCLQDESLRNLLANGGAYGLASREFMASFNTNPTLKAQLKSIYVDSLQLFVKEIPMRTELETEFGIEATEKQEYREAERGGEVRSMSLLKNGRVLDVAAEQTVS